MPSANYPGNNFSKQQPLPHHRWHMFLMSLLYITQGVAQGVVGCTQMYLTKMVPSITSATLFATLELPRYTFTVKFLMAPFVDVKFIGKPQYRRVCWVAPMQMLMALGFYLLSLGASNEKELLSSLESHAADYNPETHGVLDLVMGGPLGLLLVVFAVLCSATALQDIALDAWTVEGLPLRMQSYAGPIQTFGLDVGSTLVVLFVLLCDVDLPYLGKPLSLSQLLLGAASLAFTSAMLASFHAWYYGGGVGKISDDDYLHLSGGDRSSSEHTAASSPPLRNDGTTTAAKEKKGGGGVLAHAYRQMFLLIKDKDVQQAVLLFWCVSILPSSGQVGSTTLSRQKLLHPDFLLGLSLLSQALCILSSGVIAGLIAHRNPCDVIHRTTWFGFISVLLSAGGYTVSRAYHLGTSDLTVFTSWPTVASGMDTFWCSLTIVDLFVSLLYDVARGKIISAVAQRHSLHRGTVLTILFAMSNAGRKVPVTLAMYASDPLQSWLNHLPSDSWLKLKTNNLAPAPTGGFPLDSYYIILAVTVVIALLLQVTVVRRCLKFLRIVVLKAKSE